jgi:hypothetical protein
VDVAEFWDQVRSALGLDEPQAAGTVARAIQVVIVVLLTLGIAHWLGRWVRRAALAGRVYAEVAVLLSRATALAVYAIGGTIVRRHLRAQSRPSGCRPRIRQWCLHSSRAALSHRRLCSRWRRGRSR